MLELIVFVLMIVSIVSKSKKKQQESRNSSRQAPTAPQPPRQTGKKKTVSPLPTAKKVSQPSRKPRTPVKSSQPTAQTFEPVRDTFSTSESAQNTFQTFERPRPAAERHEEWFPIPKGKAVCRCGYCGADNLIPGHSSRSQYSCYFCRENL